jgi:hypothetical protein
MIVILIVVFGGGYYFYSTETDLIEDFSVTGVDITQETEQILTNIRKVESYKMDDSVLTDTRFISLKNTRVELPTIEAGRADPFAPLP